MTLRLLVFLSSLFFLSACATFEPSTIGSDEYAPTDRVVQLSSPRYQARARSRIRSRNKVSRLIALLQNQDPAVRSRAASELGELRSRQAVPFLIAKLADPNKFVRRTSVKALGEIRTPQAVSGVRQALHDSDQWVRHSAQNVLKKIR